MRATCHSKKSLSLTSPDVLMTRSGGGESPVYKHLWNRSSEISLNKNSRGMESYWNHSWAGLTESNTCTLEGSFLLEHRLLAFWLLQSFRVAMYRRSRHWGRLGCCSWRSWQLVLLTQVHLVEEVQGPPELVYTHHASWLHHCIETEGIMQVKVVT